jgi:CheY-like chemotaxis protein
MKDSGIPLAEELNAGSGRSRVLVVDDDGAIRDLLAEHFGARSDPFEVMTASDGFEAGRLVATFKPDVVLLDLRMPGMDGFQVCRTVKADPETSGTIVIAMTGFHTPETEARIKECGAVECFAKPVEASVLADSINEQIEKKAAGRQRRKRPAKG